MDVAAALAELEELSTQVAEAVVLAADGTVAGTSGCSPDRAARLAEAGAELLSAAGDVRPGASVVTRVDVALASGSLFAVREHDRTIVATTGPEPTAGLVTYDLRTVLRRLAEATT